MCFRGCLATGCWSLLVIACVTLVTVDYVVQHRNPACDCFSTLLCLSVVSIEDLSLLVVRKWPVLHKQEIKVICLQSRSFTFWNVFVITVILKVNVLHLWFVSHFSCFTAAPWLVFCRHFSVKYRRLWQSTCNQSKWCEIFSLCHWGLTPYSKSVDQHFSVWTALT